MIRGRYSPFKKAITDIGNISPDDGTFIVGNNTTWVGESGSTARDSIGLGADDDVEFGTITSGNITMDSDEAAGAVIDRDSDATTLLIRGHQTSGKGSSIRLSGADDAVWDGSAIIVYGDLTAAIDSNASFSVQRYDGASVPTFEDVLKIDSTGQVQFPATNAPAFTADVLISGGLQVVGSFIQFSDNSLDNGYLFTDNAGVVAVDESPYHGGQTLAHDTVIPNSGLLTIGDGVSNLDSISCPKQGSSNETFGEGAGVALLGGVTEETSGNQNSLFGFNAGNGLTIGDNNCLFGFNAGDSLTTGSDNCAFGSNAFIAATTGARNFAMGAQCMQKLTEGNDNVALGRNTLNEITTQSTSVAIGSNALKNSKSTFAQSVAVGGGAGEWSGGLENVYIGLNAGAGVSAAGSDTVRSYNTVIGSQAGAQFTGANFNVLVGRKAGYGMLSGDNNICIGYQAGDNITNAATCIIIGYDLNAGDATTNNQMNIGGIITSGDYTSSIRIGDGLTATNYIDITSGGVLTCVGTASMGGASTDVIPFTGRAVFRTIATDPTANNHAGSLGEVVYCSGTDAYYGKTVADGTDQNWTLLG